MKQKIKELRKKQLYQEIGVATIDEDLQESLLAAERIPGL